MSEPASLHAVIFSGEGGWLISQILEWDIGSQAKTQDDLDWGMPRESRYITARAFRILDGMVMRDRQEEFKDVRWQQGGLLMTPTVLLIHAA